MRRNPAQHRCSMQEPIDRISAHVPHAATSQDPGHDPADCTGRDRADKIVQSVRISLRELERRQH